MREPTRYVRLTVTVSFDGSGNSSTRSPLPSTYSVMPSTLVVWRGAAAGGFAAGGGAVVAAGLTGGGAGGGAAPAPAPNAPDTTDDPTTKLRTRASVAVVLT